MIGLQSFDHYVLAKSFSHGNKQVHLNVLVQCDPFVETAFDRRTVLAVAVLLSELSGQRIKMNFKFKFNQRLVPICCFYFFVTFSFNLVFPYFTILLRNLGLSLEDASLIGLPFEHQVMVPWLLVTIFAVGISPFVAFLFTPLLGYAGDKVLQGL